MPVCLWVHLPMHEYESQRLTQSVFLFPLRSLRQGFSWNLALPLRLLLLCTQEAPRNELSLPPQYWITDVRPYTCTPTVLDYRCKPLYLLSCGYWGSRLRFSCGAAGPSHAEAPPEPRLVVFTQRGPRVHPLSHLAVTLAALLGRWHLPSVFEVSVSQFPAPGEAVSLLLV